MARAPAIGLLTGVVLVVLAFLVPWAVGLDTGSRASRPGMPPVPPLHGYLDPKLLGPGTIPVLLIAVLGWWRLPSYAAGARWGRLLLTSYVVGLAWLVSLAYVDGSAGIARVLGAPTEYLQTARAVNDVPALLEGWVPRIDRDAPDVLTTHVAGHPPLALLFFVGLVQVGLGGSYAAGLAVTVLAATVAPGVLVTLRVLGAEGLARRATPFLVLAPTAVLSAVSADAVFTAVCVWGLACLALAATSSRRGPRVGWSLAAGLLLGSAVMLSYGLPLMGVVALAVLAAARSWRAFAVVAATSAAVVLAFAVAGFSWWEAYPVLRERYYDGVAAGRPQWYWVWGNLAALLVATGPLVGAGLGRVTALAGAVRGAVSPTRTVVLLTLGAALALVLADLSAMSKSEVERIWLPWMPWLIISLALLPDRWQRPGLALQLATAVLLQQLVWTAW